MRLLLAAVVEFIHTATLLHDDVVDESALRRGRETANAAFGNAACVLVGDFLYSRAFQMMVEAQDMRVMEVLAEATNTIAGGEVLQLMGSHDPDVDEARYLEVIRRKTAKLFEAAARLGGVLARSSPAIEQGLADYGMHVGTAFQLVDDVLDYRGESGTLGKNTADDLREGKMTLPVILALADANPAEREIITAALGKDETPEGVLAQIVAIFNRHKSLDRTVTKADEHVRKAREALAPLPASEMKTLLSDIAEFYVSRAY